MKNCENNKEINITLCKVSFATVFMSEYFFVFLSKYLDMGERRWCIVLPLLVVH